MKGGLPYPHLPIVYSAWGKIGQFKSFFYSFFKQEQKKTRMLQKYYFFFSAVFAGNSIIIKDASKIF